MKLMIFLMGWLTAPLVFAQQELFLNKNQELIELGKYIYVLEDPQGDCSIGQVSAPGADTLFRANAQAAIVSNHSGPAAWCKFSLVNQTENSCWWLSMGTPWLDSVALYEETDSGLYKVRYSGGAYEYRTRELKTAQLLFKLEIPKGETRHYYLRLRSDRLLNFTPCLSDPETIIEMNHHTDFLQGIYFGFLLLVMLYNLVIYFSLRNISALYYSLYTLGLAILMSQIKGYGFEGINRFLPGSDLITLSSGGCAVLGMLFSISFLQAQQYAPRLQKTLYLLMLITAIAAVVCLMGKSSLAFFIVEAAILPATGIVLIMGMISWKAGYEPARIFLCAWTLLLAAVVITILKDRGLLPVNDFTNHALQAGSSLEILLLSLAMGDKIKFYKLQAEKAEKEVLHALWESEKIVRTHNEILEQRVHERTRELQFAHDEIKTTNEELKVSNEELNTTNTQLHDTLQWLEAQKKVIENKNAHITESIEYAHRLQTAILPPETKMKKQLQDFFLLYKPKDIVCGDFYWYSEQDDLILVAVSDCTGHGIPAALMTVLGMAILHQVINEQKILQPSRILYELDKRLLQTLAHHGGKYTLNEGMDTSICLIEPSKGSLIFAGAKRPLLWGSNGQLKEIKGSRFPVGSVQFGEHKVFDEHLIEYHPGDTFYLFTDGFTDQFGGLKSKKLMSRNFRELLERVQDYPLPEQKQILEASLEAWRDTQPQTDDILVIGLKV